MSKLYSKSYEMPFAQFIVAQQLFKNESISYHASFGFTKIIIEVIGSRDDIAYAERLLQKLWVTRESTVFPKKHRALIQEELEAWGISYKQAKNPLAFEVITEIDQRKLERFIKHIKTLTKKPKRTKNHSDKATNNRSPLTVPDDASDLL